MHNTSIDFINRPKEFGSKVTKINVSSPGCTGRFSHRTSVQPQEGRTSRINKGTSPVLQIRIAMPELSALLGEPVTGAEQDETPAEDDDDRAE